MCGIVSLIARTGAGFYHRDVEMLEALLVLDGHFRGMDSTGAFQVLRNRQVHGIKQASHSYNLFATDAWPKFSQRTVNSARIVVGHNRKATQGKIVSENAHPFNEGKITLVHNGTLRDHKSLKDVEVDSHAICHALATEDPKTVLEKLNGAFALVWWDSDKDRLFAIRNDERPLHLVTTAGAYILISEPWMAQAICAKMQTKIEAIEPLKPGVLLEFDVDGQYTSGDVKLREPQTYNGYYGNKGGNSNLGNVAAPAKGGSSTTTKTGSSATTETKSAGTKPQLPFNPPGNVIALHPTKVKGYAPGDLIMVKLTSLTQELGTGRTKAMGTTMEPGHELCDVQGFLPSGLSAQEQKEFLNDYVLGRIARIQQGMVCGPVIHLSQIMLDYAEPTHNGKLFGGVELAWIVDNCKCSKCEKQLDSDEIEFTSIVRTGIGTKASYRIACPDCVQESLRQTNKELHDEFEQRRLAALEDSEPVGQKSSGGIILPPGASSTPTVH